MANKRIDELTAATSVAATDLLFVGDPGTGALSKATANLIRTIPYMGEHVNGGVNSLTDAQTFYFGLSFPFNVTTDSPFHIRFYCPIGGTINRAYVYQSSTTVGSNEAWSMYLRVNATTDTLIESLSSTASPRVWSNTSMGVSISAGDYFVIKSVNPTWATNPATSIYFRCIVFLDY